MDKQVNEKKISIIICVNNEILFQECRRYLNRLLIPEGYELEICPVFHAKSMTSAYNHAMESSDAGYKIYMHQDVFVCNRFFLVNLCRLFGEHPEAGMIGMVGSEHLDQNAVMWKGVRCGAVYKASEEVYEQEEIDGNHRIYDCEAVDGFMMATRTDIRWREDLFDGFDFYDISQSFEYRQAGWKVIVPEQKYPWCIHDDGNMLSLFHYNHYRKIFIRNYL